jgi:carnitine O-acetyltransferase
MTVGSPTLFKSILSEDPKGGQTFEFQDSLPKLPIPDLKSTTQKYLKALEPLLVCSFHKKRKREREN